MNNDKPTSALTGAIYGNTINSLKLAVRLCEMKRWTSTVLILSFLTIVLVSCVAVLLIVGEPPEDKNDAPLHPIASSSSYPNSSRKSSRSAADSEEEHIENHDHHNNHRHDDHQQPQLHRHNYRKRFTDAIKGVFSDLINSTKNSTTSSSTLSSPTFEEHLPRHPTISSNNKNNFKEESTENVSSRLKRQLDFGSSSTASSEERRENDNSEESYRTTLPSAMKYTPPSKRPFLRVIKTQDGRSKIGRSSSPPPSSSSPAPEIVQLSSSSEETLSSSEERAGRPKFRKNIRRFRPNANPGRHPKIQSLSSKEKYDVSQEEKDDDPGRDRKNFTLEVVQVERKVVRKEDGNIPPLFKKGNFNIQPRLMKVPKREDANRPQIVYKNTNAIRQSSPTVASTTGRALNRKGKGASPEVSSAEKSNEDDGEDRQPVVVNPHQQIPYNEQDLSEEDLKDYHDGHSTFGSKGNFTHTIISRNVAGFLPNQSGENLNKRSKSDRTIVIEKGKVTERYPEEESPFENPSSEIYAVPGGRTSSTEGYPPKQEVFPFERTKKKKGGIGVNREGRLDDNDRTSPAIPSSLEELYRKGHPGVVPAPKKVNYRRQDPLSEPYGESAGYSSPFRYNPLVDDPPLKFDPESDRFYGEPVPDNKERVAQSNSPVQVENRDSVEEVPRAKDYSKPKKTESEEQDKVEASVNRQGEGEDSSRENQLRNGNNDRFYYGRAYNPPDYGAEYDSDPAADAGTGGRDNDDAFDFIGLDDNFGPPPSQDTDREGDGPRGPGRVEVDSDFFDFPDIDGDGIRGSRGQGGFRPRAGDDNTENNNHEEEGTTEGQEQPVRRPPPKQRGRNPDGDDYEANSDYGGFGPTPGRRNIEDDDHSYDNGFIHTLQQFDEEIKKLQDEEREKLLKSTALPDLGSTEQDQSSPPPLPVRSSTTGYNKDPPLIITSPGPLEPSTYNAPPGGVGPSTPVSRLGGDVGTTIRVTDTEEEEDDDVTEANPFITSSREPPTDSGENFGGDDTTLPNRSVGAEEDDEEEGATTPDYSTERSGEVEDEK